MSPLCEPTPAKIHAKYGDRIHCGHFHPDPEIEERVREMLIDEGIAAEQLEEGCGREMHWTDAFRCVECGRWFHRACATAHFARHIAPTATADFGDDHHFWALIDGRWQLRAIEMLEEFAA